MLDELYACKCIVNLREQLIKSKATAGVVVIPYVSNKAVEVYLDLGIWSIAKQQKLSHPVSHPQAPCMRIYMPAGKNVARQNLFGPSHACMTS